MSEAKLKGHEAFPTSSDKPLPEEIKEVYALVVEMDSFPDGKISGLYPFWHGWALREAYLRGILAERNRSKNSDLNKTTE